MAGKRWAVSPARRSSSHLVERWRGGQHTSAELFSVARSTVYRAVQRAGEPKTAARTRRRP